MAFASISCQAFALGLGSCLTHIHTSKQYMLKALFNAFLSGPWPWQNEMLNCKSAAADDQQQQTVGCRRRACFRTRLVFLEIKNKALTVLQLQSTEYCIVLQYIVILWYKGQTNIMSAQNLKITSRSGVNSVGSGPAEAPGGPKKAKTKMASNVASPKCDAQIPPMDSRVVHQF